MENILKLLDKLQEMYYLFTLMMLRTLLIKKESLTSSFSHYKIKP